MRWLLLGSLLVSCVPSYVQVCGDVVCAAGQACDPIHSDHCVLPGQLESCNALGDGDACTIEVDGDGICDQNVCIQRGCGDGYVRDLEECDGTVVPADADCTTLGLGLYISQKPTCTAICTLDASSCVDRSRCGDDVVQTEFDELCDGTPPPTTVASCIDYGFGTGHLGCRSCGPAVDRCDYFGWRAAQAPHVLLSVHGTTDTDLLAVADDAGTSKLLRFNGKTWTDVDLSGCLANPSTAGLSQVFVVGNGVAFVTSATHVIRLTGTTCAAFEVTSPRRFWAASANAAFAVGGDGSVIQRFDGTSFTTSYTAPMNTRASAIGGTSASNVWVALDADLLVHFDGSSWQTVAGPSPGQLDIVSSLWVDGNDVYLAGTGGFSPSVMRRSGNGPWERLLASHPLLDAPTTIDSANVIAGTVWNGKVVVLAQFKTSYYVLVYDGRGWSSLEAPVISPKGLWASADKLYTVSGSRTLASFDGTARIDRVLPAVGTVLLAAADAQTAYVAVVGSLSSFLFSWDGARWQENQSGQRPTDITIASNVLYGVSPGGVLRWSGSDWNVVLAPVSPATLGDRVTAFGSDIFSIDKTGRSNQLHHVTLPSTLQEHAYTLSAGGSINDLWAASATVVYLVGTSGTLLRWQGGTTFTPMTSPLTDEWNTVWGFSATEVYAASNDNIIGFDGATWTQLPSPGVVIEGAWGRANDMFIRTAGGLLHHDGSAWLPVSTGAPFGLTAMDGARDSIFMVNQNAGTHQLVRVRPWH